MALPPRHELTAGDSQPRAASGSPHDLLRDAPKPSTEAHEATPAPLPADHGTINAIIVASFLLRFASRVSFSLLVFALGQRVASATLTVLVLEAFYLTELTLSPLTGTVSDRAGRKLFLLAAPVTGAAAALWLWFTAGHLPV